MCLRFVFLLITRLAAWPRVFHRDETWKTAEILILRHQLAVLQRRQPRRPNLNWADRAPDCGLLSLIPKAAPPRAAPAGHTGYHPALAPRHHPPPLGRAVPARQDRPPRHPPERQGTRPPAGQGKPRLGLPKNPRRAGRPGREGSGVDSVGGPEECRDRPRAAAHRACLVAVPVLPRRGDPGVRLLHGRLARRHPGLCAYRDRASDAAGPYPRRHAPSHRRMDCAAGPQPDDGSRRAGGPGQVHVLPAVRHAVVRAGSQCHQ
jgi:hypothetical protein